jgi:F-type H+-transporting ATPase subunit b
MESLGLDWKLLIAQVINFGLLFFVLKKVLYKPLIKSIDDRNKKISDALKNSQEIEKKLTKIEEERIELLGRAKSEAKKEKDDLIGLAISEKEMIISEAKLLAKREVEKGLQSIEMAKKEAVKNISNDYLESLTKKIYERFSDKAKKDNFPVLKSLLK